MYKVGQHQRLVACFLSGLVDVDPEESADVASEASCPVVRILQEQRKYDLNRADVQI